MSKPKNTGDTFYNKPGDLRVASKMPADLADIIAVMGVLVVVCSTAIKALQMILLTVMMLYGCLMGYLVELAK